MLYEAICDSCHSLTTYVRKVESRADTPICACGIKMRKVILSAPMGHVQADICYDSPIDGRPITNRHERIDDLKRSGCRPWEGMEQEKKEAARREGYADIALEKKLAHTTEKSLMEISETSRRALLGA